MSRMSDLDLRRQQADGLSDADRELIAAAEAFELVQQTPPPEGLALVDPLPLVPGPDVRKTRGGLKPVPGYDPDEYPFP